MATRLDPIGVSGKTVFLSHLCYFGTPKTQPQSVNRFQSDSPYAPQDPGDQALNLLFESSLAEKLHQGRTKKNGVELRVRYEQTDRHPGRVLDGAFFRRTRTRSTDRGPAKPTVADQQAGWMRLERRHACR